MDNSVDYRDGDVHGGHRSRMRARVESEGFEALSPHELIEFLLYYAIPRQDVNALAHRLIDKFGSARAVLSAQIGELRSVQGMGERTARWLALVGEATFSLERLRSEDRLMLCNCRAAFSYAARLRQALPAPCCVQLCLDMGGRLLYQNELCPSLSWGAPDTLREAMRDMLSSSARSAILLLMSERAAPEVEDYDIEHARSYAQALGAVDCELLDVILIGSDQLSSLRLRGLLSAARDTPQARALHERYLSDKPAYGSVRVQDCGWL